MLLTLGENSGGSFTALVSGELTLNEANCFQVGDAILVAEYGSTALPDGSGVDMPGFGEVKVGSRVQGTGGELPSSGPGVPENDWQRCVPAGSTDAVFTSLHKGSPRGE
ncbi:hypothetical protein [Nocardioides szechwanensis]|uniref:hypothetical protein n=1 Tax=Nocardioides szechwanensis TaxID=1005944 RepID=UPI00115F883D|nr:hypothetical protein [Nocardioides szechwanensis]